MKLRLEMKGDWGKAVEIEGGALRQAVRRGMVRGVAKGALAIQGRIKKNIARGRSEHDRLHPFTIDQKGSEHPLVDHGDLLNGISVQFISDLVAFIGVSRGAQSPKGDLVSIAAVQEFGATIAVTPKMRGYLHSRGLHLKPETKAIVIPPRPYVQPAWEEGQDEVNEIFRAEVQSEIQRLVRGA